MDLLIKVLEHAFDLPLPQYQTNGSAGMDLISAVVEDIVLKPGTIGLIPTGISVAFPSDFNIEVRSRSGIALKNQVIVLNSPGTIDSDYRGEIKVIMMNFGKDDFIVSRGMRIAQMVITKVEKAEIKIVDELPQTLRNVGGFGSTGR